MSVLSTIMPLLPVSVKLALSRLEPQVLDGLQEIRIREGRPLEIVFNGSYRFVDASGQLTAAGDTGYRPTHEDLTRMLDMLSHHSLYAYEEELKRGYITVQGGHRVGLAGRTVLERGAVKQIRDIASLNIRLAREVTGAGVKLLPLIADEAHQTVYHTLIVSPPQQGKTTLLRDLARLISHGQWPGVSGDWKGRKIGIVDERSEIAACYKGVPRFDVGPRTDVLDSCPKAEGMMMMIRSMSPEVLVVDEIGREEDAEAMEEAIHAGIRVMATAHGNSLDDIANRPVTSRLIAQKRFDRIVVLAGGSQPGTIQGVFDGRKTPVHRHVPMKV